MSEQNFDFLKRMRDFFQPLRDFSVQPAVNETVLDDSWAIVIPRNADKLQCRSAMDLQKYLAKVMLIDVPVKHERTTGKNIVLSVIPEQEDRCCIWHVSPDGITVSAANSRELLFGVIALEDAMSLRQAPYLEIGRHVKPRLARMRSTHSGSGLDDFPDWQLDAILHAGFTAIDLFVNGPDWTTKGFCRINDLIERASDYGLEVVLYSYMTCQVHPDDPDAVKALDQVFGNIFRVHPGFKAIHLVGESLEFPSRDDATVKVDNIVNGEDGLQSAAPGVGYYPGQDYPEYISAIRDVIHKVSPDVEVIFNTYNWGWAPLESRRKFLERFPEDVTLQVTYDIFKQNRRKHLACPVMDYSIFAEDPGFYFTSEVEAASELGIKSIRVTSNLAGNTWDFGCAPYAPVPFRWAKRMSILRHYLLEHHVDSFYDSHHYGWWPNPCIDLAKVYFSDDPPGDDPTDFLRRIAVRDYGVAAADDIVEVWKIWSRAMDHYVASNEDQYGPWRVGPAYPFMFHPAISRTMDEKNIVFPVTSESFRGANIIKTFYHPWENDTQSPGPMRYPVEISELEIMLEEWQNGLDKLTSAICTLSDRQRNNADHLKALGKFIRNMIRTTIGIKRFFLANIRLQCASEPGDLKLELDIIDRLLAEEKANVLDTFEAVEFDSRLGWEPRMGYVCDSWHLNWKLRQLAISQEEVRQYRQMIDL